MTDASHDTSEVAVGKSPSAANVVTFNIVVRFNADGYVAAAAAEAFDEDESCITDDWSDNADESSPWRQVIITITAPPPVSEIFAVTIPDARVSGPLTLTMSEG